MLRGSGTRNGVFQHQADAYLSQANPVSATLYEVLPVTRNVRIIALMTNITWAVTQPHPLGIVITVDGNAISFNADNPVSATSYFPVWTAALDETSQGSTTEDALGYRNKPFFIEGRSVRVQVRVTWATTQPTPLVCRVKYAKIP